MRWRDGCLELGLSEVLPAGTPGAPSFFLDFRERLEARVRIELTIEVLQTSALPLGYRAG